jgi:hypothetical protein
MHKPLLTAVVLGSLLMTGVANAQYINSAMKADTPTSNFTFNTDGTATDNVTGLIWMRCNEGQTFSDNNTSSNYLDDQCNGSAMPLNWQAALQQVQTANAANANGHNDWRVPNLPELKSIVEHRAWAPAINSSVFPGQSPDDALWTSTPTNHPDHPSASTAVYFNNGDDLWVERNAELPIRLVRGGQ